MNNQKFLIAFSILCCLSLSAFSQQINNPDSLRADSIHHATETILLQQQQQQQLDSLIRIQLQKELQQANGDKQKTKELEEKLKSIALNDSIRNAAQLQRIEQLKKNATGYPVAPFRDTLFFIYTKVGSFSAKDRATAVDQRINKLYGDPFYRQDSLKLNETENGFDILYNNETLILSVSKLDALWFGKDVKEIADSYLTKIKGEISKERKENSLNNWLRRIGLVALIILGVAVLIFLINRLFKRLRFLLSKNRNKYLGGITIRKIKILSAAQLQKIVFQIINALRIIVMILAIYLSLPLLFSVFPETEAWTSKLLEWILTPARSALTGVLHFLPNLFTILVIYFIFRYTIKGIKYFVREIEKGDIQLEGFHADWAQPTFNIVKFLLYAFMLVIVFPYLPGSGSPAFRGVSVFIGVIFSLGSSSAISNMVAGLVITYMRPFKIGDRIKIGDITGDVMEKTMLVTRVRTIKNEDVTLPNSTVLSGSTINYSTNTKPEDKGLIVHTTVTIGYDVPWKDMYAALIDAADRTNLILKEPKPFVLQTSLDDFYVSYQINGYTKEANQQSTIYSELHQNIQDCCNEAGIEILSPHYSQLRDGNMTTIPTDYLKKDYKAPSFNINIDREEK